MARLNWLDDQGTSTLIDNYAQKLGSFVEAIADGRIDAKELSAQEGRLVELMKKVEPRLDDALHADVTQLLCELSAFNVMQMLHEMASSRPHARFVG